MRGIAVLLVMALIVSICPEVKAEDTKVGEKVVGSVFVAGPGIAKVVSAASVLGTMETCAITGIGLAMIVGIVREYQTDPAKRGMRRYDPTKDCTYLNQTRNVEAKEWSTGAYGWKVRNATPDISTEVVQIRIGTGNKWEKPEGTNMMGLKGYPIA